MDADSRRHQFDMALIVTAVAYTVSFVFMLQLQRTPLFHALSGKSYVMYLWAVRLASGEIPVGQLYYGPPLPLWYMSSLFSVFGVNMAVIRLLGSLLTTVACVLCWDLGRKLGDDRTGLMAGIALALFGPLHYYEAILPGTALTVCLLTGALCLLVRAVHSDHWWWWASSGLLIGIAGLSRPNALIIVPVACLWVAFLSRQSRARRAAAIGLLIASCALAQLAGGGVEVAIHGRRASNPTMGVSLYLGNGPGASVGYGEASFVRATVLGGDVQSFIREASVRLGRSLDARQASQYWAGQAVSHMLSNPWRTVQHFARKTLLFFTPYEIPDNWDYEFWRERISVLGILLGFAHVLPLALLGMASALVVRRRDASMLAPVLVAYVLSTALTLVLSRYRVMIGPLFVAWAAVGANGLRQWRRRQPLVSVSLFAVTAVLTTGLTLLPAPYDRALTRSNAFVDLGVLYEQMNRNDLAVKAYGDAVAAHPGQYVAHVYAGNLRASAGDAPRALEHYMAARKSGELVAAELTKLAVLELETRRPDSSRDTAGDVIRRWPTYHPAYRSYARSLRVLGDKQGATWSRVEAEILARTGPG